jgi:hypothetical protein
VANPWAKAAHLGQTTANEDVEDAEWLKREGKKLSYSALDISENLANRYSQQLRALCDMRTISGHYSRPAALLS